MARRKNIPVYPAKSFDEAVEKIQEMQNDDIFNLIIKNVSTFR